MNFQKTNEKAGICTLLPFAFQSAHCWLSRLHREKINAQWSFCRMFQCIDFLGRRPFKNHRGIQAGRPS